MDSFYRYRGILALFLSWTIFVTGLSAQTCPAGQFFNTYNNRCEPSIVLEPQVVVEPTPEFNCFLAHGRWDPVARVCHPGPPNVVTVGANNPQLCVQSYTDMIMAGIPSPNLEKVIVKGINAYMAAIGLPQYGGAGCSQDTSFNRFRVSRPAESGAIGFFTIVSMLQKPATSRTPEEQAAVAELTAELKRLNIKTAQSAYDEYLDFKSNPCIYVAPFGFPYSPPIVCEQENWAGLFATLESYATPPNFTAIGAILAYPNTATAQGTLRSSDVAKKAAELAAAAGAGVGGVAGTFIASSIQPSLAIRMHKAVLPFVLWDEDEASARAFVRNGGTGVRALFQIAGRLAGPAGVIASALVESIFQLLDAVADAQRGPKLRDAVTRARNATIDLSTYVNSENGLKTLYGMYCENLNLVPAILENLTTPANADFTLTNAFYDVLEPKAQLINYRSWDNQNWQARFRWNTGDFLHTKLGAITGHSDFIINYIDWEGRHLTANFSTTNGVFLIRGYPFGVSALSDSLYVVNSANQKTRFTLNNRTTGRRGGLWLGQPRTALVLRMFNGAETIETTTMFRAREWNAVPAEAKQVFLSPRSPRFAEFRLTSSYISPLSDTVALRFPNGGAGYSTAIVSVGNTGQFLSPLSSVLPGAPLFAFMTPEGASVAAQFTHIN